MKNNNSRMKPNTIIAGTNKAGTTSLFRHLSDHPDVCCSKVKEISFFNRVMPTVSTADWDEYLSNFSNCDPDKKITLEASPAYLSGGKKTAQLINNCLPGVKLVFILREPIERIESNFKRRKERLGDTVKNITIDDHIDNLFENLKVGCRKEESECNVVGELSTLNYVKLLGEYLQIIPSDRIGVFFFDDLKIDTRSFVIDVCRFLEINSDIYRKSNYIFHIENKTRTYKSKRLQKAVFNANMKLEPVLNKIPAVRRTIRSLYNMVNETHPSAEKMGDRARRRLDGHFKEKNAALSTLIKEHYPEKRLPKWLV